MTLSHYLRALRVQWTVIVMATAIVLALAAAYTFSKSPTYQATSELFVTFDGLNTTATDFQSGSTFTQQRVKSYISLATTPTVIERVNEALGTDESRREMVSRIKAENPLGTTLIDITVADGDATQAAKLANTVADELALYIQKVETPDRRGATSPVKVTLTSPADVPTAPVSPRTMLNLILGLIAGLALGLGLAVLRDQLDTTITSISDVEKLTGAVPLGVVPYDRGTPQHPLVEPGEQAGRAEAFRTLRTNLQFTNVDEPPRIIVITSPLPGEGKSTTSANIASTLAFSGASVVLIEADLRKPAISKYLGVSSSAGLTSVLAGQFDLREVLVPYGQENLAVLPSGPKPPNPSELLGSGHMTRLLDELSQHFDYVIVDAPPLLPVTDAAVLAASADGAVLVLRHGKTTRESADRAVQSLKTVNVTLLGTVLNFAPRRGRNGYDGYGYGYGYGTPAAGTVSAPRKKATHAAGGLDSIRASGPPPPNGFPEPVTDPSGIRINGDAQARSGLSRKSRR